MKLTKKLEAEIFQVYNTWLDSYLNGDVKTYDSFLDDAYRFIGSTDNEEFLNRNDTTNFFRQTADQLAGKAEVRNSIKTLKQIDELIFITDLFDAYFLNDEEWAYYGRFRFTSALRKNKEGWRFVYQHFSTPDSKAQDGETLGTEKISKENQELRDAIKRRTFELEAKNRELEIEGALERIRAQAVAMKQSSDLLDIVVTMRNEFTKLGHEAHYFWHMMWLPEKYEKAMTSGDGSKIGFVMTLPRHIHGDISLLADWEKSNVPFVVYPMNAEEAIDYVDKMVALGDFKNIDPQAPSHDDIRHIGGLTFVMARTTHGEIGYSLPGIVKNPPKEDLDILIQFAGAFDLAHRRFLDLQKAEQQAREVQIELALEKVRSRTMAMQHSDELQEASFLLDQQVRALGINTWGCAFNIYGENESTEWFGNEAGVLHTYKVPREGIFKEYYQKGQKGESLVIKEFKGKECVAHYEYMSSLPIIGDVLKTLKETNDGFPTYQIDHVVFFKYGYLLFITREDVPEAHDIFKRFAKVFEQTYTRFLDLQKAEAQAREAQIEAALERVRSRTMGMQRSDELQESALLLFQQVEALGLPPFACGFNIWDEDKKEATAWMGSINGLQPAFKTDSSRDVYLPIYEAAQNGESLFVIEQSGKELEAHYEYLTTIPIFRDIILESWKQEGVSTPTFQIIHCAFFTQGYLMFISFEPVKAYYEIFKRFAKVFEQTYTRFLDLQKAEAQARESQIELGLERVRARAMAMQHSNELSGLVATVLNELTKLDFSLTWCIINIINEADQSNMVWATNPEGGTEPESYYMKFEDYPFHHAMMKAWKAQKIKFVYVLEGKEKKIYDEYLYNETEFKRFSTKVKKANRALDKYVASFTFCNFGGLQTVASEPLSDENLEILERFGNVFDMTYTRFNDLQKAEAQAKEAQIEAALEKVRSRTMAMQHSNELPEAANTLFLEVQALGIPAWSCGYNILSEDKKSSNCIMSSEGELQEPFVLPLTQHKSLKPWHKAIINEEEFFVYGQKGKDLVAHYKYMESLPELKGTFELFEKAGIKLPTQQFNHLVRFNEGFLLFITYEEVPEAHDIFKRFGKVFEQTYTRFLDLKKAEAQARESEIELALERVRARTMAMQKSEEIGDVAFILFQQLKSLGGNLWGTGFGFCKTDSDTDEFWFANEKGIMPHLKIPNTKDPAHKQMYQGWKNNLEFHSIEKGGKELKAHYKYMLTVPDVQPIFQSMLDDGIAFPKWQKWHAAYFKYGYLLVITTETYENKDIFKRFAKVFEQTYTRFLDLQKAEEQAREAEIELALERVRARTMAMHKSEELKDVIKVVNDQFVHLKINTEHTGFVMDYKARNDYDIWIADKLEVPSHITIPYFDSIYYNRFNEAKKKGEDFFATNLNFKEKNKFYKKLIEYIPDLPEETKEFLFNVPGLAASTVLLDNVCLYIENFEGIPYTDEENNILMRFGKVFQQTYTRFLDLQKAEAQAREAQIETALERIRSRSMAMQKSNELLEAGELLWNEIIKLGIDCFTSGYVLMDDNENIGWNYTPNPSTGKILEQAIGIPHKQTTPMRKIAASWKAKEPMCVIELTKKQTIAHQTFVAEKGINFPFSAKQLVEISPEEIVLHTFNFKQGYLLIVGGEKISKAQIDLMLRFTKVFQQTYTRFLDLKKAEAQAREAQIEAALERIRSQSMGMQTSGDLSNVTNEMFAQLRQFGGDLYATGIVFCDKHEGLVEQWHSIPKAGMTSPFLVPIDLDYIHQYRYDEWKKGTKLFSVEIPSDFIKQHFEAIFNLPSTQKILKEFEDQNTPMPAAPEWEIDYGASFKYGYILVSSLQPFKEADILPRFAKVFEQTYTRFLDLQKAEAQAHEAKIEAALEKVRSRTMAMQKGEEVKDVVVLLYKELIALGVTNFATCGYVEINEETNRQATWVTNPGGDSLGLFHLPLTGDVHFDARYEAWKNKQNVFHQTVAGKERKKHLEYAITTFNSKEAEEMVLTQFPDPTVFYCFNFSHGYLHLVCGSYLSKEEESLLARFTRVFEQTYARFLDLEKAEAQAREAQINLAVERVRAKALAMHKSEEIMEVVAKLKEEVMALDIPDVIAATIFLNEGDDKVRMWDLSTLEKDNNGYQIPFDITFKLKKRDPNLYVKRVWENPENYFIEVQESKDFKRIIAWLRENNQDKIADEVKEYTETTNLKRLHHAVKKLNNGKLVIDLLNPPSDEMETILTKMGGAFDLAYKRFEDLQKAEAQTREAQIEAALEKVRSRSLAMHKPDELQEVVAVVAEKLKDLGVIYDAGGVLLCTYFPDNKDVVQWIAVDDFSTSGRYFLPYFDNPIFSEAWDSKMRGDAYFSKEFSVEAKNEFFKHAFKNSDYKQMPDDYKKFVLNANQHHLSAAWSKNSAIIIPSLTGAVPTESDAEIMKRFAKVFEQAYIRFMDLEKAEAQAREANKQASLDRVRGQISSMRSTTDLDRITPLVWNELTNMDVPFIRCGVFIMDESTKIVDVHLSAPDGHSLAIMSLPFSANPFTKNTIEHWQRKKVYREHWNREEFLDFMKSMMELGQIQSKETFQDAESPPESLDLHFVPFKQGMLYVGAENPLNDKQIELVQSLANAFAMAYARYEDFTKLEKAKRSVETALSELKATQNQLIQSEKMASLGELTAGIAHEIQNPLNFVNNFSEVSNELIDEMNEEIDKGDLEEAKFIAQDIKQNLEKINHHGKRADAIVKGMLQHSRSSKAEKEPTDINKLADEYLRLAYHGLRAKDKSFNATLTTDFDENIGKVNVVPQDIGRVMLNLITNAFYAVNEKTKEGIEGYQPEVTVRTKKVLNTIEISIIDNGNGIPEAIKEKIFQPFFTTKPTGSGTGLGLSLAYDIVKVHNGQLKVETKEGEGTEFILILPI